MSKLQNLEIPQELLVHSLSHDGRGITQIQNKTVFLKGALPQEKVTFKIHQKHSTYYEGTSLDILEPSKERVRPPCEHFGVCGGCDLQHMSLALQSELKQNTLLEQLKHFGQVTPKTVLPPLTVSATGYRRKARLGVKFVIKKNKLLIGFREKSSRYLADLNRCAILHPRIGEHLLELSALIGSLDCYNHIPQIEVAMGDEDLALIIRHLVPLSLSDQEKIVHFANETGIHFYLQPNAPLPLLKLWPKDISDRLSYTLPEFNLRFLFHPLDFTQINLEMNRLMVSQAITKLDLQPEDSVLDLFCGIGNFTLPIARYAKHVTGIEGTEDMVRRGNENAAFNHLTNILFYSANLFEPPSDAPWLKMHYDKILLDPPRVGAKEIIPYLKHLKAKKIVYVSCNPATLARDAKELVHECGYQLTEAGIMNMFPHTSHIEAMAVFEK